eukprot:7546873-Alexandrium_andersonii.AAC.1
MSASLVGSEMCIRDRPSAPCSPCQAQRAQCQSRASSSCGSPGAASEPVSYTHLTLPTICSV